MLFVFPPKENFKKKMIALNESLSCFDTCSKMKITWFSVFLATLQQTGIICSCHIDPSNIS